jgi:hypothetical protein
MKRFVITEDEKNHISKMYGLINEQSDLWSKEIIGEISGATKDNIINAIKTNKPLVTNAKLIVDNPNAGNLVYTKTISVDKNFWKNAGMGAFVNGCKNGSLEFDMNFYVKDGKYKIVFDNFTPKPGLINPANGERCVGAHSPGILTKTPPSSAGDQLSGRSGSWQTYVKALEFFIPNYIETIKTGMTQNNSNYDF